MANEVQGDRAQPAPVEYSVLGEAEPTVADWERIWWHVPGARQARAVLLPLLALTLFGGLLLAPISELSWSVSIVPSLVVYPARGALMLFPKRAFDVGAAYMRWLLQRRARERVAPHWGLRLALGTLSLMLFLTGWHFWHADEMPQAGPGHEVAAGEAGSADRTRAVRGATAQGQEQEPSGGRQ